MLYITPLILIPLVTVLFIGKGSGRKREIDEIYRKIFYRATGLEFLDDDVLDAAFKIYRELSEKEPTIPIYKPEKPIQVGEDFSVMLSDVKDAYLLLSNLSDAVHRYGFNEAFTVRDLASTLNLSPEIAKRWIMEGVRLGIIKETETSGERFYLFVRESIVTILDRMISSLENLKDSLISVSEEQFVPASEISGGEQFTEVTVDELDFESIMNKIEEIINNMCLRKLGDSSGTFISKLRKLRGSLGKELSSKILECRRLYRLFKDAGYEPKDEEIEECKSALNDLIKRVD